MRLSAYEIETINDLSRQFFTEKAEVYLFGSRVHDHLKGGDIDLMISCEDTSVLNMQQKVLFLVALMKKIGERKVDVVFDTENLRKRKSFYQSILNNRIKISNS